MMQYLIFALCWAFIVIIELGGVASGQVQNDPKSYLGQSTMILLAGMNAAFWYTMFYHSDLDKRMLAWTFVVIHIAFFVMYFLANTWLNEDAKWGPKMNTFGQYRTIFDVLFGLGPTLYLLYFVGKEVVTDIKDMK